MSKRGLLDINNSVWGIDAARVLGISRVTFYNRVRKGVYNIPCVRCPNGFRYSIREVFKMAHPSLKEKQIEELILEYRIKMAKVKKREKTGGKK